MEYNNNTEQQEIQDSLISELKKKYNKYLNFHKKDMEIIKRDNNEYIFYNVNWLDTSNFYFLCILSQWWIQYKNELEDCSFTFFVTKEIRETLTTYADVVNKFYPKFFNNIETIKIEGEDLLLFKNWVYSTFEKYRLL